MPARVMLRDDAGQALLSYLPGTRDGLPWADNTTLSVPAVHVAAAVMRTFPGWLMSVSPVFGQELLSRGARLHRHAFTMALDLQPGMPEDDPPPGFRLTACDRPAAAIQPAVSAAFPPGHPDFHESDHVVRPPVTTRDAQDEPSELEQLLAGTLIGTLLPCSVLAVDAVGVVVAGCLINHLEPRPWITLMFRDPGHSPHGLGALVLQASAARAGDAGIVSIGLAVTAGNPAQGVYERAGFTVLDESFTVYIPELAPPVQ